MLLCALFVRHFRKLVQDGRIYVAMPPLYRIDVGKHVYYALDDGERDGILARIEAEGIKGKVNIQRFKGLGEMNPLQLRETTMDPKTRTMIRVTLPQEYEERASVRDLVERLMGKNPEHRFAFIQANAASVDEEIIDA